MPPAADPYRTLGLARGATLAEVKKAYRQLVKANHPDAAGEAALPRFLAIQAAYDQIVGPGAAGRPGAGSASPRRPWDADPDRADATRRAYGGRARRSRTSGAGRASGQGSTGRASAGSGPPTGADPSPGAGSPPGSGPSPGSPPGDGEANDSQSPPPPGERSGPPNKATLGSTSYDGADAEPFEPDWGGASWYGTTSGTYWTLNPKEYADPRKHGPEYQARARRAAQAARESEAATGPVASEAGVDADGAEAGPEAPTPPPTHTTSSWWDATAGPAADPAARSGPSSQESDPVSASGATDDPVSAGAGPRVEGWTWLDGANPGLAGRVGRAVLGWIPLALAIGWAGGELTTCAGSAADCDASARAVVWVAQVGALAVLLLVPALASLAAIAAVATIVVAVPAALALSAPGTDSSLERSTAVLAIVVVVAWIVGLVVGLVRAGRRRREGLS